MINWRSQMRYEGAPMSHGFQRTVLLVEADTALRRLISLGLQGHEIGVIEALSPDQLPMGVETSNPGLLVLDVDSGIHSDWSLLAAIQANPELAILPTVVLTWDGSLPDLEAHSHLSSLAFDQVICMAKPFDARLLHTTIEDLFITSSLSQTISEASAFAPSAVASPFAAPSFSFTPAPMAAPSLCPIITALSLLLVVAGSMIHIALCLLGITIMVAALLWWTLGKKPIVLEPNERLLLPIAAAGS